MSGAGWWADVRAVAITDRRRMASAEALARGDWDAIAREVAAAIARVAGPGVAVQVREKDLDGGPLFALVRAAVATGARVIVNDRLDVALAAGAHGVHLPERGLTVAAARAIVAAAGAGVGAGGFAIGASRHSIEGVRASAAEGADLVQLGPIWATPGKGPALGAAALGAARAAIAEAAAGAGARARLVAVGGVDDEARAAEARAAGADAVAAIRAAWASDGGAAGWLR